MTSQRSRNRLVRQLRDMGIRSEPVLETIRSMPRHIFVDEALAGRAYENVALPIGLNQTISQPYIVARMTEALLEVGALDRVLEVGTGCGYQAAVLAQFAGEVYSIERLRSLQNNARQRLQALQCRNVKLKHGDGHQGWPEHAPYNGILVTAAPPSVPPVLLEQLAPGGRLVIPVGPNRERQHLWAVTRGEEGWVEQHLGGVSFVPMLGGAG